MLEPRARPGVSTGSHEWSGGSYDFFFVLFFVVFLVVFLAAFFLAINRYLLSGVRVVCNLKLLKICVNDFLRDAH